MPPYEEEFVEDELTKIYDSETAALESKRELEIITEKNGNGNGNGNQLKPFDYSQVDDGTAKELKSKENDIRRITDVAATEIGKRLKEAQELLSNHKNGIFTAWYESLGFKQRTVFNLINRYELYRANLHDKNLIESLPLTLSYDISKKTAPNELVQRVLEGDITSHKDYIALLKDKKKFEEAYNNKLGEKARLETSVNDSKIIIESKEKTIKVLMDKIDEANKNKTIVLTDEQSQRALEVTIKKAQEIEREKTELIRQLEEARKDGQLNKIIIGKEQHIETLNNDIAEMSQKINQMKLQIVAFEFYRDFVNNAKGFFSNQISKTLITNLSPEHLQMFQKDMFQLSNLVIGWLEYINMTFKLNIVIPVNESEIENIDGK